MKKTYLSENQVYELVENNIFAYKEEESLKSRDITGNYEFTDGLPALSLPGGDIGQIGMLSASSNLYGFEKDLAKALKTLTKLLHGNKNLSYIAFSDSLNLQSIYLQNILQKPEIYEIPSEDHDFLQDLVSQAIPKSIKKASFKPQTTVNAAIILKGDVGLYPLYQFETYNEEIFANVAVLQRSLVNKRNKVLTEKWIEDKAVTLFENLDSEYLYQILSDTLDTHFMETVATIDPNLPIFKVEAFSSGKITVVDLS